MPRVPPPNRALSSLPLRAKGSLLALLVGLPIASCSGNGSESPATGGQAATGATASLGGGPTTGGASGLSGAPGSAGGTPTSGGSIGAGGGASAGTPGTGGAGATPTGGSTTAGGTPASGGAATAGGSTATAGAKSQGGSGGVSASGGAGGTTALGGATATGGATSKGGATAAGGATSGGAISTGGASNGGVSTGGASVGGASGDRCDVGVYNASTPPTSYAISGGPSVHDPTVILVSGVYYSANSGLSLWTRQSTNLTSWTNIRQGLGGTNPSWIKSYVSAFDQAGGDLWAPDFSYFGGQYHLYFAASTFGSKNSCIGHATRAAMNTGAWADSGGPVICSNSPAFGSYTNVNWNTIDPAVILDETGSPWLVFGSGWDGIHIVRLTSAGAIDSASTITNIARRSGANVVENAYMVRRCGYYYLFMSWDKCCAGATSTYNIRVGRSTSMTGGFVDKDGVALTSGGGTKIMGDGNGWVGPGGQMVVINGARAYLVYHAYDASASGNVFAMHVSDLYWDSAGWPVTTASP